MKGSKNGTTSVVSRVLCPSVFFFSFWCMRTWHSFKIQSVQKKSLQVSLTEVSGSVPPFLDRSHQQRSDCGDMKPKETECSQLVKAGG